MCKWIPASSLQVEKLKIRKLGDLPAITQSITRVGFELEDETKLLRPRQRGKGPQYQNPIFLLQMMWRRRHCLSLLEFLLMASGLGEERWRFWIVFRYFSDASGIAPRRQMHKTRVKLLREKKRFICLQMSNTRVFLFCCYIAWWGMIVCHSVILKTQTQGQQLDFCDCS